VNHQPTFRSVSSKLIVAAVAAAALLSAGPACAQQQVEQRRPASASGTVDVSVPTGSVRVVAWGRNEVRVTGSVGRGAERLEFSGSNGRTTVAVIFPRGGRGVRGSDLDVYVPAGSRVSVRSISAEAEVRGVRGAVEVTTVSGGVRVEGHPASVDATSQSGDIDVDANTGRVNAGSTSGNVRVDGTVRNEVEARTVSGDIEVEADAASLRAETVSGTVRATAVGGRATVRTVSGDARVEGPRLRGDFQTVTGSLVLVGALDPRGTSTASAHSGDVELRLRSGATVQAEITTFSGDVETTISGARVTRVSRREQQVSVGSGGPRVELRTFSGSVRIVRD